jgi:hypothetical protein
MQTLRAIAYAVTCGIITGLCVTGFWALLIVTP